MNEEIVFPGHRGTPLEVLLSAFEFEARNFFYHALDYNIDIDGLEGEELEQAMDNYRSDFSNIVDSLEYLIEGIYDIVDDVGAAIPED